MILRIFILILLLLWFKSPAQLTDYFTDDNLSKNPLWSGDTTLFTVHSGKLHLFAPPVSGRAQISSPSSAISEGQWQFTAEMDFNPSSSNYIKVFLVSDRPDIAGAVNGYFVMLGNTTDEVSLYRQSGTTITRIIDGSDGRLNLTAVEISVRITTDDNGNWNLFTKMADEPDWIAEGSATDTSIKTSQWFGLLCVFTSTRSDKFHFDEITVKGKTWPDRTPPSLIKANLNSSKQVMLEFSEPLDQPSVMNLQNYKFTDTGYKVINVVQGEGPEMAIIQITELQEGVPVLLKISGIKDVSGNSMTESVSELIFLLPYSAKAGDVIFNEVMADPSPPAGLPEVEYLEIFNRTERFINLEKWSISDGSSTAKFPFSVIAPGGFKLIYSSGVLINFSNSLQVNSFPTLNNQSDKLGLYNESGLLIDLLNYSASWHTVQGKSEGGWSLERIDPDDFCRKEDNWASAVHPEGGTPGRLNSVYASRPDRIPPLLTDAEPVSPTTLLLSFNEVLDNDAARELKLKIDAYKGNIISVVLKVPNQIIIETDIPFEQNLRYKFQVSGVRDCPGNLIESGSRMDFFVLSDSASVADVVINEILFNPVPGGNDFVEIFNASDKFLRLRNWTIERISKKENLKSGLFPSMLLQPYCFLLLTSDPLLLKNYFPMVPDSLIMKVPLPSLPDDSATLILLNEKRKRIDSVHYDEQYHLSLIRNNEGLSLERITSAVPAVSRENWRTPAFGLPTPGRKNSVSHGIRLDQSFFKPYPTVFSLSDPESFTLINYELSGPDNFFSVSVFDFEGRKIKELVNNMNPGTSGFIRWDGDRSDGRPADPGFYLIVADVYNQAGQNARYRSRVVVVK